MRYYDISITPQGGTTPMFAWGSHPNGNYDPGALNVDFDMPVLPYGVPSGGQTITLEGVSLEAIGQAQKFAGANLVMRGGMQSGLPLANPTQAGVLVAGQIFQSFGNWEGTEMTLDFVILPSVYTMQNPGNITLNWTAGQSLAAALQACLSVAYPNMPISINIGSNLVLDRDVHAFFSTLDGLAQKVAELTNAYFGGQIVTITIQAGKIVVYDRTYQPAPIQINFTDLIGQPTWIEPNVMQMKTVMRADLQVGAMISMPKGYQNVPGFVSTSAYSLPSSLKYQSSFQNNFQIIQLRHIGNFRSSDASNWATVFNCVMSG